MTSQRKNESFAKLEFFRERERKREWKNEKIKAHDDTLREADDVNKDFLLLNQIFFVIPRLIAYKISKYLCPNVKVWHG